MTLLDVPGARLSYDVAGAGPLLLLIPGGAMPGAAFTGLQAALADRFTVVRYDSRGLGGSSFAGEPHPITVPGQADDALALLDALSPDAPAFVLGSSGGALTGLDLVTRHPDRVRLLVAHEPPLTYLLDEPDDAEAVMRVYREQGPAAAMAAFLGATGLDREAQDGPPPDPAFMASLVGNFDVFFGQMWAGIGAYRADVEALRSRPVLLGVGETSDQAAERATRELARLLDRDPVTFVGGHTGFTEDPERFAKELAPLLV
ncbi:alpha/beta fold hydrolase [Pseudonocardia sp. CA-107938]|uniref:alpha/beta fold hydrolase n=1 Tax=Pseudonocardia sp. CA-107938 TaxID=3240021 RepID=UPI003D9144F5